MMRNLLAVDLGAVTVGSLQRLSEDGVELNRELLTGFKNRFM